MDAASQLVEIGDLARQTGTAASALRYYEELGLMCPDERRAGRRKYSAAAAERVALIRLYQDVGFSLGEIRDLLNVSPRKRRAWTRVAEQKIRELDARIIEAERAKDLLEHAVACRHPDLYACPAFRGELQARLASGEGSQR